MPGENPLIQAPQNTLHSLESTSYVHCLVHQHLHMHQHTHQHAFTPILHQSLTILPAPMATQDSKFNMHLPRETTRQSFAPFTALHKATQKSFTSTKPGRWGALHVCIAWKIYYHEQLKKMQQKPNSLCRELTADYPPATCLPDSLQHKESDQPSCRHPNLDCQCGHSGKTAENVSHSNRSYLSDLCTSSSSCHSHKRDWEKLEQPPNLQWKEKHDEMEKHRGQQTDKTKDLPLRDKSWDRTVISELDVRHSGSLDRKRPLEYDSYIKVKRMKQEQDDQFDSLKTLHTDPSSHFIPVQHVNISDLSVLYPNSSRCNVTRALGGFVSYPGAEMHPYQTASWELMWDKRSELHSRQNALKDYSVNAYKAIGVPLVAQRQKEAFHGFFAPPLNFPLAVRQQETVNLRRRELPHSSHENCHLHRARHQLPQPGFLATSYLGP